MKTEKNILIAFLLNLSFSIAELLGGVLTGSVAVLSDALHDFGDAISIAAALILERKSKLPPDGTYTYGRGRLSVLGGAINALILIIGSVIVIFSAVSRILHPSPIHYNGMMIFAVFGVITNAIAAYVTHGAESINQKAVNLHMLEDVLGWVVVLIGAVIMRFTDLWILDPLMSIAVALFILIHAIKTLLQALSPMLQKAPSHLHMEDVRCHLMEIENIIDVHHIHLWSLDGQTVCATLHVVTSGDPSEIKKEIRHALTHIGISHATIETECPGEQCYDPQWSIKSTAHHCHHHHHHHH